MTSTSLPVPRAHKPRRQLQWLIYLALTLGAALMVTPFVFLVLSSLKTDTDILAYPPRLLPTVWDFGNYTDMWRQEHFGRFFLNSLFVSIGQTALILATSTCAAFAFARLTFPGRTVMFVFFLATLMLPSQVTLIPVYVLIKQVPLLGGNDLFGMGGTGLINTFAGLIVPHYVSVTAIFLMRQVMLTLPRDLDYAARMDGCNEFGIFWYVTLPLSQAAIATQAVLTFQASWNEFLWPLLVGQRRELWTIQVALAQLSNGVSAGVTPWTHLLAATVVATAPVIVVFLIGQRYMVQGIALTGMK